MIDPTASGPISHGVPQRSNADILRLRKQLLNPTLSVSYNEPLKIVRGEGVTVVRFPPARPNRLLKYCYWTLKLPLFYPRRTRLEPAINKLRSIFSAWIERFEPVNQYFSSLLTAGFEPSESVFSVCR